MKRILGILLVMMVAFSTGVMAQSAEAQGLEIAQKMDAADNGWVDETMDMTMVLTNAHGESSTRQVHLKQKEVSGDGDKSISVFRNPNDIKGTALLTYSHKVGADQQWLYLPAIKRVKRISSRNKSGSFMGSEFAYEDISSQEIEKYEHKYLGDEVLDERNHNMLERIPVDENSGYTKQIVWVDAEHYYISKIDFYDRKGELLKTLVFSGYNQYLNKYWRASDQTMENHQSKKKTKLSWSNRKFRSGLTSADFTQNALKRTR